MAKSSTTFKKRHPVSQEAREKIRQSLKGRTHSVSRKTAQKISIALIGKVIPTEVREKISQSLKGISVRGRYVMTDDVKAKISESNIGKNAGANHGNWIVDRSLLKKKDDRNDSAYQEWRKLVWLRDGFKCKIADQNCDGRIEAHHILGWVDHPELRYQINNGITLCHAHHPRKRSEEKRLSPYFQEVVSVSKVT